MTTILGDYDLLTRLASGGMAEVHVARSRTNGEIAIVKQMLQKFVNKPEFVEIEYRCGDPVAVNGEELSPFDLLAPRPRDESAALALD